MYITIHEFFNYLNILNAKFERKTKDKYRSDTVNSNTVNSKLRVNSNFFAN